MARCHARLLTSIHDDPDTRGLRPLEQSAYAYVLLARKDINHAGVVQYNPRAWAKASKDATERLVLEQLPGLIQAGFIVVDEETDEVLVRSFMRNDGVAKQPNVLISACRHARQVASPQIRATLASELRRIAADSAYRLNGPSSEALRDTVAVLDPDGQLPALVIVNPISQEGSAKPSGKASGKPSTRSSVQSAAEQLPLAQTEGFSELFAEPLGVGDGVGDGGVTPVLENLGGRAHVRTRPVPRSASAGPRTNHDHPVQLCGRSHDPEPACARCGAARRARAADVDTAARRDAEERAARRTAIDACTSCDEYGQVLDPDDTCPVPVFCDHTRSSAAQLARHRGVAS